MTEPVHPAPWTVGNYRTAIGGIRYCVYDALNGLVLDTDSLKAAADLTKTKNAIAADYSAEIQAVIARYEDALNYRDEEIAKVRKRLSDQIDQLTKALEAQRAA